MGFDMGVLKPDLSFPRLVVGTKTAKEYRCMVVIYDASDRDPRIAIDLL
jgi:hypothetical protein